MIAKTQDPGLPQPTLGPTVLMRAPLRLSSVWEGWCTRSCQRSDLEASWMQGAGFWNHTLNTDHFFLA